MTFQELRKKYHWNEGYPSYRLLEHEDDNGRIIDEPELWRPLGMEADEYDRKIMVCNIHFHITLFFSGVLIINVVLTL